VSVIDSSGARFLRQFLRDSRHVEVMALWSLVWMSQAWMTALASFSVALALHQGWSFGRCGIILVPHLAGLLGVTWHFRLRRDVPFSPVERQLFQLGILSTNLCSHQTLSRKPLVRSCLVRAQPTYRRRLRFQSVA
jgi:hypothetical protein